MKQTGNTIHNGNLQEFLDSAANAADYGQRQFFTPPNLAAALCRPLAAGHKEIVMDLHFGSGALAFAAASRQAIGLDIDVRVKKLDSSHQKPEARQDGTADSSASPSGLWPLDSGISRPSGSEWHVEQADITQWYPLAAEAGFTAPFILINPPFSLRWYADRLAPLRQSAIPEVARAMNEYPEQIDSTLASFLIALDLLSAEGEGFMVCNAATARRFFGSPGGKPEARSQKPEARNQSQEKEEAESAAPSCLDSGFSSLDSVRGIHPDLRKFIWLWLEIPAAKFEGLAAPMDFAVIYFSRSHALYSSSSSSNQQSTINNHQSSILFLTSPGSTPEAVANTLFHESVFHAHHGSRIRFDHEARPKSTIERFHTVTREYKQRHRGTKPDWNIRLDAKGAIRTYLTPFQNCSKKLCRTLISKLQAIDGQTPIQLCVTATSRTALREAMQCGVWRIHPEVADAIATALADHDKDGAPFYRPSPTQSLGWIDEMGELECLAPGIGTCAPGDRCPIETRIEKTTWKGDKINLAGEKEELAYSGEELLVTLTDPDGSKHHFHVRRDEETHEDEIDPRTNKVRVRHWPLSTLIEHFKIPIPKDITALRPDDYQRHLARLIQIEQMVRRNLAASAA